MAAFLAGGMTRRYLFAFGAIALVAVAGLAALIDYRQTTNVRATQMRLGGSLRAQIQGAALASQEAVFFGETGAADTRSSQLGQRIAAIRTSYAALMDQEGVQRRTLSAPALAFFFEPPFRIDERISDYLGNLEALAVALAVAQDSADQAALSGDISSDSQVLDGALAAFVNKVADEHAAANLRLLVFVGGGLAIIVLLVIEGVFVVVRPVIRASTRAEERIVDPQVQSNTPAPSGPTPSIACARASRFSTRPSGWRFPTRLSGPSMGWRTRLFCAAPAMTTLFGILPSAA